jgi:hypothetical protein
MVRIWCAPPRKCCAPALSAVALRGAPVALRGACGAPPCSGRMWYEFASWRPSVCRVSTRSRPAACSRPVHMPTDRLDTLAFWLIVSTDTVATPFRLAYLERQANTATSRAVRLSSWISNTAFGTCDQPLHTGLADEGAASLVPLAVCSSIITKKLSQNMHLLGCGVHLTPGDSLGRFEKVRDEGEDFGHHLGGPG